MSTPKQKRVAKQPVADAARDLSWMEGIVLDEDFDIDEAQEFTKWRFPDRET